jgi:hypothetical protein
MFKKFRQKIEEKKYSNSFFWKSLIFGEDLVWNMGILKILEIINSINLKINPKYLFLDKNMRFVVSKRWAGFGDSLISLVNAWRYAKNTKRTLVIDWRFSRYLPESKIKTNAFSLFFKPITDIEGVPIICDDSVNNLNYPVPFFPDKWNDTNINQKEFNYYWAGWKIDKNEANDLIKIKKDAPASVVVFDVPLYKTGLSLRSYRKFLSKLKLREPIQKKVDDFVDKNFKGKKVIGLHLRHGNNECKGYYKKKWWVDESKIIDKCYEAIKEAERKIGCKCIVFLCTDSKYTEKKFKSIIPNIITRKKRFAPLNKGPLHVPSLGIKGAVDALVEMFLLSHCDALIYYPRSCFTMYPRMCKKYIFEKCLHDFDFTEYIMRLINGYCLPK